MEEELGSALFIKGVNGKRTVELTRAGIKFKLCAQQIIKTLYQVKKELNEDEQVPLIKIGSSVDLTHATIFEKLALLNSIYNNNINLMIMDHALIKEAISEGILNLAFVTEPIINKKISSFPVFCEKVGLVVLKNHPFAKKKSLDCIEDLENENLIFYKTFVKDQPEINSYKCKKRFTTNQIGFVSELIHNHNGVAFLTPNTVQNEIQNGHLVYVPIHENLMNWEINYYLVSRKNEIFYNQIFQDEQQIEST